MPSLILGDKHPLVSRSVGCQLYSCIASSSCDYTPIKYIGYTGKYALCTSASCEQDPINKHILNCSCDVNYGPAVGLNDGTNFNNLQGNKVYSLYSGINQNLLSKQTCNKGNWGDCLNQICIIDPNNPKKAICECLKVSFSPWITFQYKTNPKPCNCNNSSGASNKDYEEINLFYKLYVFNSK